MAIYRFSAQPCQGLIIDEDPTKVVAIVADNDRLLELITRGIKEFNLALVMCPPGMTDITPVYWKGNNSIYRLDVNKEGDAAELYIIPKSPESQIVEIPAGGSWEERITTADTITLRLPEQTWIQPLIGPLDDDRRIRLHELIVSM